MNQEASMSINMPDCHLENEEMEILLKNFPDGVIALDLETTGLSPLIDKIIEISAVKVTKNGIDSFNQLINPQIPIPPFTITIHGIRDDMVRNSPTIDKVLPEFMKFIGDLPLIAHNAQFDTGFIVFNLHQEKLGVTKSPIYCSCRLSRKVFNEMPNHKLATVASGLDIEIVNHHRALDDAIASLRIYAHGLLRACDEKKQKQTKNESHILDLSSFDMDKSFEIPDHLELLKEKVHTQEIIEIKYTGGSHKNKFRPVKALSLLPLPAGNVLYGYCFLSKLHKSFLLSKIVDWKTISTKRRIEILRKK